MDSAAGIAKVTGWAPRKIEIDVDLIHPADLLIRQFYFPGWQAWIDQSEETRIGVSPTQSTGFVKLSAPAGRYRIRMELTPLWPEIVGTLITAIGLLLLIAWICVRSIVESKTDPGG